MDSNSAKTQVQVNKQTILIPPKNNKGDFPFYNCKKEIAADLETDFKKTFLQINF